MHSQAVSVKSYMELWSIHMLSTIDTNNDNAESKLSIFVERNSYLNIQAIKDLELGGRGKDTYQIVKTNMS